jgi:hypothetical protein
MLSVAHARDRAICRAIETGELAEKDLIQASQQAERGIRPVSAERRARVLGSVAAGMLGSAESQA